MKTIGILGGMGPEATAKIYLDIIRIFQKRFGAKYDKDFPPIFIYSMPIPDVVEELENEKSLIRLLIKGAKKLEKAGADFIIIACNTVQCYLRQMRTAISIPILSMPEETAKIIKERDYKKVALLSTETTVRAKLFNNISESLGIKVLIPDKEQQQVVTRAIMDVLAGTASKTDKRPLIEIIKDLEKQGAQATILGCTDLPFIITQKDCTSKLLDTMQIMANAAVKKSKLI